MTLEVSSMMHLIAYPISLIKVFPGSFDRSWTCPIATNDTVYMDPEIWVSDKVPLDEAPIDTTTLMNLGIRQDVQACLFMIKRVQSSTNESTSLRTRRLCSGGGDSVSFETWYFCTIIYYI